MGNLLAHLRIQRFQGGIWAGDIKDGRVAESVAWTGKPLYLEECSGFI